jgi:hypothetical protein
VEAARDHAPLAQQEHKKQHKKSEKHKKAGNTHRAKSAQKAEAGEKRRKTDRVETAINRKKPKGWAGVHDTRSVASAGAGFTALWPADRWKPASPLGGLAWLLLPVRP